MVDISTLDNGLRVVTQHMPNTRIVDLCAFVGVGARYEETENGLSHAVEHMVFNGTKTRSQLDILKAVEGRGGAMNATTSDETTDYRISVLKEDMKQALFVLADMLQHPLMSKKDLIKEKKVISAEIKEGADDNDELLFDAFLNAAYGYQPIANLVAGRMQLMRQITPEQLKEHMRFFYTAPNMIISVAGDVNHDEIVQMCQEAFCDLASTQAPQAAPAIYQGDYEGVSKNFEQIKVGIGFKGYSVHDDDRFAATLISSVLGDGMSSRLNQEVREKRGLVYSINTDVECFADTGLWSVYLTSAPKLMNESISVVCDEILKLSVSLTDAELEQAKKQYAAATIFNHEKGANKALTNAQKLFFQGRINPIESTLNKIEAVTRSDIVRVATQMFSSKPTFAAAGPIRRLIPYDCVCQMLNGSKSDAPKPVCLIKGTDHPKTRAIRDEKSNNPLSR